MKTTQEMIEVMQAYADGKKIEHNSYKYWGPATTPVWDWRTTDYRVALTQDEMLSRLKAASDELKEWIDPLLCGNNGFGLKKAIIEWMQASDEFHNNVKETKK